MTLSILAVDDSATMRSILEMTFAGEDVTVVTVPSAEVAKNQLPTLQPDIAIVDNSLPGSASYDLCRAMKQQQPNLRVMVLASEHHPFDEAKGRSAGIDAHVSKPFETQAIIDKVLGMVTRASQRPAAPAEAAPSPSAQSPIGGGFAPAPAAAIPSIGNSPAATAPRGRQQTVLGTGGALPPLPSLSASSSGEPRRPGFAQHSNFGTAPTEERPISAPPPAPLGSGPRAQVSARYSSAPPSAASIGLEQKLAGLGLNKNQIEGVLALSKEVIEQVVWEVVPDLAETLIKEEIRRLTAK